MSDFIQILQCFVNKLSPTGVLIKIVDYKQQSDLLKLNFKYKTYNLCYFPTQQQLKVGNFKLLCQAIIECCQSRDKENV